MEEKGGGGVTTEEGWGGEGGGVVEGVRCFSLVGGREEATAEAAEEVEEEEEGEVLGGDLVVGAGGEGVGWVGEGVAKRGAFFSEKRSSWESLSSSEVSRSAIRTSLFLAVVDLRREAEREEEGGKRRSSNKDP